MPIFQHDGFSCDVDVFTDGPNFVARFHDASKEQRAEQIVNLVVVEPGYGYLTLKFKGGNGLLSGMLDETIFASDDLVAAAITFVESLSPLSAEAYLPHRVVHVKTSSAVEYNGEY